MWLTLLAGAIGFGGMFAVYTYIAPTVTEVGGLAEAAVPVFLLSFGLGMVAGTWLAGIMADWSIFRSLLIGARRAWAPRCLPSGSPPPPAGLALPGGLPDHRAWARCSWSTCSCA